MDFYGSCIGIITITPIKDRLKKMITFFVIFALPAIALLYWGSLNNFDYRFFIGLGITLYGIAYFCA
jgi:phosphate starvation-inducible membrane PsiE